MRRAPLLGLLCAGLLLPGALAAPFAHAGRVRQGETDAFTFDNTSYAACTLQPVRWVVTLAYAPVTDALTLDAGGQSAEGANGVASVTFDSGTCVAFDVSIAGTSVAHRATYGVTVHSAGDGRPID